MGGGSWSFRDFETVSRARESKSREEVFERRTIEHAMDPINITMRESRDGVDHPASNAILVGFDVTGSMGHVPHHFASEKGLGLFMADLLEKRPIPDPQLCVAAFGDAGCDRYPLQVGQFESDNKVDDWLTKIVLEGGGGDSPESYGLVHYFAGRYTSIDCFEKRNQKGFCFTIGDEVPHDLMPAAQIRRVFGVEQAEDVTIQAAIAAAQRMYDVIHVVIGPRGEPAEHAIEAWRKLLGQNVLVLGDYTAIAELLIATIGVRHGMTVDAVTEGFRSEATDLVRRSGITELARTSPTEGGIARV